jgi:hypothetical protein
MCLYMLEMIERDVGYPSRDMSSDAGSVNPGEMKVYPGPASYGIGGPTPNSGGSDAMVSALPGPGYSFLEFRADEDSSESERASAFEAHLKRWQQHRYETNRAATLALEKAQSQQVHNNLNGEFLEVDDAEGTQFIGGMAKMMANAAKAKIMAIGGMSPNGCRLPQWYCRKHLARSGSRSAQRVISEAMDNARFSQTRQQLLEAIQGQCSGKIDALPRSYAMEICGPMQYRVDTLTTMYLHDYEDGDICADLKLCKHQSLGLTKGALNP